MLLEKKQQQQKSLALRSACASRRAPIVCESRCARARVCERGRRERQKKREARASKGHSPSSPTGGRASAALAEPQTVPRSAGMAWTLPGARCAAVGVQPRLSPAAACRAVDPGLCYSSMERVRVVVWAGGGGETRTHGLDGESPRLHAGLKRQRSVTSPREMRCGAAGCGSTEDDECRGASGEEGGLRCKK